MEKSDFPHAGVKTVVFHGFIMPDGTEVQYSKSILSSVWNNEVKPAIETLLRREVIKDYAVEN